MDADAVALHILESMIQEASKEVTLSQVAHEKRVRSIWGVSERVTPVKGELVQRSILEGGRGRDIYGQEKSNESRYFECSMCNRQVAGSRFAAHVARCIQRGSRR